MIVLSYRRADSPGFARALRERLVQELGADRVFLDVEAIEAGADFRERLRATVAKADALVVVIGPEWLASATAAPNRLHEPDDPVRHEVATALANNVPVLPVLVDGAAMPAADALPDDLKALADRNAVVLSNERFESDAQQLLDALGAGSIRRTRRRIAMLAAGLLLTAAALVATVIARRAEEAPFVLTVQLQEGSSGVPVGAGNLIMRAAQDVWTRAVDGAGKARFDDLPASLRGGSVTLSPRVAGFDTTSHTVWIAEELVTLRLNRMPGPSVTVRGVVLDTEGRTVAGADLDFDGLANATSDSAGRFTLTIPRSPGTVLRLRATVDDVVGYHDNVTLPASNTLVVRFRPGG